VLPTRFDAFPTVIAESASYGLPTISYRTGGLPSNVLHGRTGILIDEGLRAEAFADAVIELMSSTERYNDMANAALRFSRDELNWDSWARQMVAKITLGLERRTAAISATT
jgi:glycosyltransferase involved in cell wall biosynthesis